MDLNILDIFTTIGEYFVTIITFIFDTIGTIFTLGILGIIVTIVLWLISPDPIKRWLRWRYVWLFRRHPAVAIKPEFADLVRDGNIEFLEDKLLAKTADTQRKEEFYEMAPLGWDIIGARADIERDQEEDLIDRLLEPADSAAPLRFVCIRGESGSGKSTLAWRVAAELHTQHRAVVIHVIKEEDENVWYRVARFCEERGRHLYVLVDDLFRNEEVRQAIGRLNRWLPLTVLATSQPHEYRPQGLKGEVTPPIDLGPPSREEKERVLRMLRSLGWKVGDLNSEQLARLEHASEFAVLMAELTTGEGFKEYMRHALEELKKQDPVLHGAYEYICFSYSYGISMPAPVLERLHSKGRYYKLPNRKGAQGWVFYDERGPEWVRPGHQLRANVARELYEEERDPETVLQELVKEIDVSVPFQRRFIAFLLRSLAVQRIEVAEAAQPSIEQEVAKIFRYASTPGELFIWQNFYLALDRYDEAEQCIDLALAAEPVTAQDGEFLVKAYPKTSPRTLNKGASL